MERIPLFYRDGVLVRFYHPCLDQWQYHFMLDTADGITILRLSDVGEATARIFDFNNRDRLLERQALQVVGRYPTDAAWKRVQGFNSD